MKKGFCLRSYTSESIKAYWKNLELFLDFEERIPEKVSDSHLSI